MFARNCLLLVRIIAGIHIAFFVQSFLITWDQINLTMKYGEDARGHLLAEWIQKAGIDGNAQALEVIKAVFPLIGIKLIINQLQSLLLLFGGLMMLTFQILLEIYFVFGIGKQCPYKKWYAIQLAILICQPLSCQIRRADAGCLCALENSALKMLWAAAHLFLPSILEIFKCVVQEIEIVRGMWRDRQNLPPDNAVSAAPGA